MVSYCNDGQSYDPATGGCDAAAGRSDYAYERLTGYYSKRDGVRVSAMNYPEIDALGRTKQSRQYVAGVANPFAFAYEYNLGGTTSLCKLIILQRPMEIKFQTFSASPEPNPLTQIRRCTLGVRRTAPTVARTFPFAPGDVTA